MDIIPSLSRVPTTNEVSSEHDPGGRGGAGEIHTQKILSPYNKNKNMDYLSIPSIHPSVHQSVHRSIHPFAYPVVEPIVKTQENKKKETPAMPESKKKNDG